jgi:general secretion pathway protein A
MEYFRTLNLCKEPFSNSPDPEFFFQSRQHVACLQKLELAIRLRRGLNVVMGEVGTGKTTLCRQLIRKVAEDPRLETHLILDPHFGSPIELLSAIAQMFGLFSSAPESDSSSVQIKESIRNYLFRRGVDEQRIVVLIIDEGQKLSDFCLEILRELLNYETNEYKLLQTVIFAQKEFREIIAGRPNFADRINYCHTLGAMSFSDTKQMVLFRLNQAKDGFQPPALFSNLGFIALYRATGGYPRKIVHLCHQVLLTLIVQSQSRAGWKVVRWCTGMLYPTRTKSRLRMLPWVVGCILMLAPFYLFTAGRMELTVSSWLSLPAFLETDSPKKVVAQPEPIPSRQIADRHNGNVDETPDIAPRASNDTTIEATPERADTEPCAAGATAPSTPADTDGFKTSDNEGNSGSTAPSFAKDDRFSPILGRVAVMKKETLAQMIRRIYGDFDAKHLQAVLSINPDIKNVSVIKAGMIVSFPAVPVAPDPAGQCWYLQVALKESLEEAYELLRRTPPSVPPLRLLPYWSKAGGGMKYSVIVNQCFTSRDSALKASDKLSSLFPVHPVAFSAWEKDVVYFAK